MEHNIPRADRLAELYVLCGQAHLDRGKTWSDEAKAISLREALPMFREACRLMPRDKTIVEKYQQCREALGSAME